MTSALGQQLRALREAKGMSLRTVEKLTGISNPYLSQLETGKIEKPSPHILHKIASTYGVTYESLMEAAGYLVAQTEGNSGRSLSGKALRTIGDLSPEEEKAVLAFIEMVKSQRKK